MGKLVWIDHRTYRLHGPVGDVQREYVYHPASGVERQPARLAVHPGRPELRIDLAATPEQPGDQPGNPELPAQWFPERKRLPAAVPVEDHVW
jgi:hypothetical protein